MQGWQILGQSQRLVLSKALKDAPLMGRLSQGWFVGEVREVDLDANRFQLRSVPNVGTVRRVVDVLHAENARKYLGHGAKIFGSFECDAQGRPRLMRVERMEPYQLQASMPV
jgi:hypothetical protein